MRPSPSIFVAAVAAVAAASFALAAPPGLGEQFPGPLLATAVRGRIPSTREPGATSVVAFVRTSEPASRQALPQLASAADRFGSAISVVAISDEPVSVLRDFTVSPQWSDRLSFAVAADPTRNAFQTVFGTNAFPELPVVFVVRSGRVQWRGAAADLGAVLGEVVAGTWDIEAAKRAAEQQRLWDSQMSRIEGMAESGRVDEALAALDESCRSAMPAQQATCAGRRFSMLVEAKRVADALKVGEEILRSPANPKQPAGLAWALATAVPGDAAALAFALKAAEASDRALSGRDAMVGAILARVQFLSGDRVLAAKTARRARCTPAPRVGGAGAAPRPARSEAKQSLERSAHARRNDQHHVAQRSFGREAHRESDQREIHHGDHDRVYRVRESARRHVQGRHHA